MRHRADGLAGDISGKIAKDVLDIEWSERTGEPRQIVESRGLKQVTDDSALDAAIDAVIAANPDKVEEVKVKAESGRLVRRSGDESNRWKGESAEGKCDFAAPPRSARRGVIRGFLSKNAQTGFCQVHCGNFHPFADERKKTNKYRYFSAFHLDTRFGVKPAVLLR